jgi:hypothetical protein
MAGRGGLEGGQRAPAEGGLRRQPQRLQLRQPAYEMGGGLEVCGPLSQGFRTDQQKCPYVGLVTALCAVCKVKVPGGNLAVVYSGG